ncbi:MAG TPA: hypothetical protein VIV57_00950, partial [Anaeromyxobacter sp.]
MSPFVTSVLLVVGLVAFLVTLARRLAPLRALRSEDRQAPVREGAERGPEHHLVEEASELRERTRADRRIVDVAEVVADALT